jgi:fatty-acyl-CoA synthase
MNVITSLADIEALECQPYESLVLARSTYELISLAAQRFPQREAFRYLPDGDMATAPRCITYAALIENINRAANLFRSLGIGPDDAVAILAPNMPETQYALWGAQVAGRACPINYLLQPEHIAALLKASNAKLIVALGPNDELAIWPTVQKVIALCPLPVLQIRVDGLGESDGRHEPENEHEHIQAGQQDGGRAVGPKTAQNMIFQHQIGLQPSSLLHSELLNTEQNSNHRICACFHTGGTTGAPKLALHTHGNEVHTSTLAPLFYGFDEHTVELNGFPLFHVAGAFVYGLALLSIGATQVLPTLSGMRNAAFVKNYWKFCEREKITALACVPTILATLVNAPVDADISSVKVAYTGGSPLPSELAAQFEAKLNIPVRNILGMTECAGLVAIEPAASPRVPGSVGLRLPFTQVRVVPWRDGTACLDEDCAAGETGIVVIGGPHVSPGYSDAARNAGMFETLSNGEHWLVSGDLGHLDPDEKSRGYIHVTGRAKDVIIRGSHNIDPGLVEEAFLAHPAVALCAVVGEPDAYAGELPVAFVTLKPGAVIDAQALLQAVAPTVYERPAVPKRVTVIDAMPMTAIGKIFKPALRLKAIEVKLAEILEGVAPEKSVSVHGEDRSGGQVAIIKISGEASEEIRADVRQRLTAIATKHEIQFAHSYS